MTRLDGAQFTAGGCNETVSKKVAIAAEST
jgi:hypothetical protein